MIKSYALAVPIALIAGASLPYLPPYSPDLNPIEQFLSMIKIRCSAPLPGLGTAS
jgi:hypothetical protein